MFQQQIPLAGTARIGPGKSSWDLSTSQTYVVSSSTKMKVAFGRDYRQIALHMEESYLNARIRAGGERSNEVTAISRRHPN